MREMEFFGHELAVGGTGAGDVVPVGAAGAGVEGDFGFAHAEFGV